MDPTANVVDSARKGSAISADGDDVKRKRKEARDVVRDILLSVVYRAVRRAAYKTARFSYNVDPEASHRENIFDSHCHLDRVWAKMKMRKCCSDVARPCSSLRMNPKLFHEFGSKFEGCISVFCDPDTWVRNRVSIYNLCMNHHSEYYVHVQ